MIKIDTLYTLYVYSINAKIQRNQTLIDEYNKKVEEYLPQLSAIEPLISGIINYADLLNGKVSSLPKNVLEEASTALKYANIIIKDYHGIRSPMTTLAEENFVLASKKISVKVYKEILRKCNNKIGDWLLQTGKVYHEKFLGYISLRHMSSPNRPNWGKSNKNKQAIIDRGGIPYNKEDETRCLEAGIPYHGEAWIDKEYPNGLLVVYWRMNSFIHQYLSENHTVRFRATKGNYGIVKMLSDFYATGHLDPSKYVRVETPREAYEKKVALSIQNKLNKANAVKK